MRFQSFWSGLKRDTRFVASGVSGGAACASIFGKKTTISSSENALRSESVSIFGAVGSLAVLVTILIRLRFFGPLRTQGCQQFDAVFILLKFGNKQLAV